jgi:gamma-glutamyltranspeptidase/glutathione hydrolase
MDMVKRCNRRTFLALTSGTIAGLAASRATAADRSTKNQGVVVGNPNAAEAGAEILAVGGNAIDAAIAGALVAGVVAVPMCGIGGYGGHVTIGLPSGKVTTIDFNSTAPAAARPDMFPLDASGQVKNNVHLTGWLAAGVPGTLAGLQLALDKYGTLPFRRIVQPAIRIARDGFVNQRSYDYWQKSAQSHLERDAESLRLFTRNGKPLQRGDTFRNPELADMLQELADAGSAEPFYRGRIAREIAQQFKANGGIVTEADFAEYQAVEATPLQLDWFGHGIFTAPLTAGGLTVLQVCNSLAALDWQQFPKDGPTRTQTMVEALRIAWGDRLRLFGDPKFVDVPIDRLLSKKYADESAQRVKTAIAEKRPVDVPSDGRTAGGTINLSAGDASGTMAAITLTHGDSFGARVTVKGMGLLLGHGMSRFDPVPGRLNSIAPGKRPLNNMCPSVVLRNGHPMLAIGGTGGRRIPNAMLQVLLHFLGDGRSIDDSVQAPRIHTEGDTSLHIERGYSHADIDYLQKIGYTMKPPLNSFVSAVQLSVGSDGRPKLIAVGDQLAEQSVPPGMREERPSVSRPQ